jgi:hypothetical protein
MIGPPPGRARATMPKRTRSGVAALTAAALLASACASVGPGSIERDRFDNAAAIADSWTRQILMNIVRMRYAEPPVFLDVVSVINQYAIGGQVSAGLNANAALDGGNTVNLGANARYEDRPTITYQPLSGEKFTRSLLSPPPPVRLMSLVEAGYPIDFLFRVGVRSLNGVRNRSDIPFLKQEPDPDFTRLLEALRRVQASGSVGMRVKRGPAGEAVMFFFRINADRDIAADAAFIREVLKLPADRMEFDVVFGSQPSHEGEIALLSRSLLEMMFELGADIEPPPEDVSEGRVRATEMGPPEEQLIRIHSQKEPPHDAFAAVRHHGYWFWIDNRDMDSKTMLSFMLILFSLVESGKEAAGPLVTIGTGG